MKKSFVLLASALAALSLPSAANISAASPAYSPAALARAKAMVAQPVQANTCTPEELNRRVNACINTQCASLGAAGGIPFYSCINSCVASAQASCRS